MSQSALPPDPPASIAPRAAWWVPYLIGWGVFLRIEFDRALERFAARRTPLDWLLAADPDTLVELALLIIAPLAWRLGSPRARAIGELAGWLSGRICSGWIRGFLGSALVAGVSLLASAHVGARFGDLPPAYHDEYSYLFQAETFLAGRVSYPSHEAARLFDQMHVVNEGRFASRYFPGAGLWMAPFVAAGHPYWGQWLAGAIFAVLTYWIGNELAGGCCGLVAGLLTALSPGMALFSNLLLAHHPTLVGLGFFLLGFLRIIRRRSTGWGVVSGIGLAYAMLCRPLTAAGVALPFGVWFLVWMTRSIMTRRAGDVSPLVVRESESRTAENLRPLAACLALALPLIIGLAALFFYNRAITGNGWLTPYSLYTETYTPRHVYGFNNVVWGENHPGPRVLENYDKWAENLTPNLAAANVQARLVASWKWTLGLVPLSLALAGGFVLWRRLPWETWLVLAAIVSLHAVHIPYWYVGIEHYHYVFESGPLWLLWTAVASVVATRTWREGRRGWTAVWWGAVLAAAVALNWTVNGGVWSAPLPRAVTEIKFARSKHGQFKSLVARQAEPLPALVLVEADPTDRHIDYVTNSPDLAGPVVIGRYISDVVPLADVKRLFPDRTVFLYRARDNRWSRL